MGVFLQHERECAPLLFADSEKKVIYTEDVMRSAAEEV